MNELYENTYKNQKHFSFGKNWQNFLKLIDDNRIKMAKLSLVDFLGGVDAIKNKTFIDVGSGSGLFSLAAYLLGAAKVVSFDIDDFSVTCTEYLREKYGDRQYWNIWKGSILDEEFVSSLCQYDIVYSWGVLHHTGDMWKAIEIAMKLVKKNGLFYIAIYNERKGFPSSHFWLKAKRFYNRSNIFGKKVIEIIYFFYFFSAGVLCFENRLKYIRNYSSCRGMSWYTDVVDWLGGFPYEFCKSDKIIDFFKKYNFKLVNLKKDKGDGTGCNEYLFKKL